MTERNPPRIAFHAHRNSKQPIIRDMSHFGDLNLIGEVPVPCDIRARSPKTVLLGPRRSNRNGSLQRSVGGAEGGALMPDESPSAADCRRRGGDAAMKLMLKRTSDRLLSGPAADCRRRDAVRCWRPANCRGKRAGCDQQNRVVASPALAGRRGGKNNEAICCILIDVRSHFRLTSLHALDTSEQTTTVRELAQSATGLCKKYWLWRGGHWSQTNWSYWRTFNEREVSWNWTVTLLLYSDYRLHRVK